PGARGDGTRSRAPHHLVPRERPVRVPHLRGRPPAWPRLPRPRRARGAGSEDAARPDRRRALPDLPVAGRAPLLPLPPPPLAAAGTLGGERGMHLLNPLLYLVLAAGLALFTWSLLPGAAIAAAAGAAAPWALLVIPTDVHYWGLTVARDLPAHLLALGALAAACSGRFGLAGLALGLACSVRPDAVLYSLSLGAVALVVRPAPR